MNLTYILQNIKDLVSVQIENHGIDLSNRSLSIVDSTFIRATSPDSGVSRLIPLAHITEFIFDTDIPSQSYSVEKVEFDEFDYVVRSLTIDRPDFVLIKRLLTEVNATGKTGDQANILVDLYSCSGGSNRFFKTTYHNGEIDFEIKALRRQLFWLSEEEQEYLQETTIGKKEQDWYVSEEEQEDEEDSQ